jgi:hypothetical protein
MILPMRLSLNRTHFEGKTGIFFEIQYFQSILHPQPAYLLPKQLL